MMINLNSKRIYVAGHRGMVGSAVLRLLQQEGASVLTAARDQLDLRDQTQVRQWMAANKPEMVIICAAKVGGILANKTYPADFLYDNMMIEANLIHESYEIGVEKLLFLGSSCIYPKNPVGPLQESDLLTGPLEETNEAYAIAKIAGIKLCESYRVQHGCDFISAMPTNLYGPGDNYDLASSHVIPALIRKFHEARAAGESTVSVWGSGKPRREFLHVDDCASGIIHLLKHYSGIQHVNLGFGSDIEISALATLIARTVGFNGSIVYDASKPDGTFQKLLNTDVITSLGWSPSISLEDGLASTYETYLKTV